MINNYSYDPKKIVPYRDTVFEEEGAKKYNYKEIYVKGYTNLKDIKDISVKDRTVSLGSVTMGQNHHFTLTIDKLQTMTHPTYGEFLPVKSLTYKPLALESTHLNFGIFADFPIIHKRKMGSIQITLLDTAENEYESNVIDWFSSCHSTNSGFVKPMGEIVATAHYKGYSNNGKVSCHYYFEVIPDGDVSTTRNYDNPSIKEITFNALIVSPIYSGPNSMGWKTSTDVKRYIPE